MDETPDASTWFDPYDYDPYDDQGIGVVCGLFLLLPGRFSGISFLLLQLMGFFPEPRVRGALILTNTSTLL